MTSDQTLSRRLVLLILFWGFLLPQTALGVLNLRAWTLVAGEATERELNTALVMFGSEIGIILAVAGFFWIYRRGKTEIGWKLALGSLVVHVSYIWLSLATIGDIIPSTIQPWIVNQGEVARWNITLFMPGAFLSLYALSKSFFDGVKETRSGPIVLATTIGMPVVWYLFVSISQPAWLGQYAVVVSIVIGTAIVVLFLGAVTRLFDNLIHKDSSSRLVEKHYLIAAALGLAAPLGGLVLNKHIPFPADFQTTGVYLLTVLNGFVLLVKPGGSRFSPLKLFVRCMVFPFIFYFFVVFLPFLPLSLIAVLAMGAGFLMLTPLALGLFQSRITLAEYSNAKARMGQPRALTLGILGLTVLPGYLLLDATLDKRALDSSLEYFYSHDISGAALSQSELQRSAEALVQLRDRKSDIQLPYISGIYNTVVFGNLVLADKKIARMYRLLTNEELPSKKVSIFGSGGRVGSGFRGATLVAPNRDTKISNIEHSAYAVGGATVRLTLQNMSNDTHTLFVDHIKLPEGVFVAGLRLKIEDEWVSGRIFDRKTALWVFQKITEVRRDPALLYYQSPTMAELRVYPFPSAGEREVEIDLEFHPQMDARIAIGDQQIDLNPSADSPSVFTQRGELLLGDALPDLAFRREPYIHFILDYSSGSKADPEQYLEQIIRVSEQLAISQCRITAANISIAASDERAGALLNVTETAAIATHIENIELPEGGGLWIQQAIAKEITSAHEATDANAFHRVPVFVALGGEQGSITEDVVLDPWSWLMPDMDRWYSYSGGKLQEHTIRQSAASVTRQQIGSRMVVALRQGSKTVVAPADRSSIFSVNEPFDVQVFQPSEGRFAPISIDHQSNNRNARWPKFAEIWSQWRRANLNPSVVESQRSAMLQISRENSLLLPLTSFIVVESPSQWEILKRKEQQSLSNHSGLDFEEEQQTPEPAWWLMLAGLLGFLYIRERKGPRRPADVSGRG